ncbi:MAG: response regulator transcription factor [Mariprofundaceae bacterium]
MTPSVLLLDDDPWVTKKLAKKLNESEECELIGCAANFEDGLRAIERLKPDVIVLDLLLEGGSGTSLIRKALTNNVDTECMVLTKIMNSKAFFAALQSGAKGYVLKQYGLERVMDLFHDFLNGGSPVPPGLARGLIDKVSTPHNREEKERVELTAKEKEVLTLLAKGFSRNEVADLMQISVHTVATHVKHIYKKLNVNSYGAAVFEAILLRLITPSKKMERYIISSIDTFRGDPSISVSDYYQA